MRGLLLLLLTLLPQAVFGATPFTGFTFTPPPGDVSIHYLSAIFGVVDGVLHGTGSQIVGTMFGVFNAALLSMGAIVLMYILFVSVMRTAHEGEVMGKQWSSVWIPIRVVVGIILMLPKASGYSLIQIFIMWLVVQGVGAADSVWAASLNYFERGGILVQTNQSITASPTEQMLNPNIVFSAGGILKAETCMYTVRNALIKNQAIVGVNVPDFTSTIKVAGASSGQSPPCYSGDQRPECAGKSDTKGVIYFPGDVTYAGNNYKGICGSVTWPFTLVPVGARPDQASQMVPDTGGSLDSRSLAALQVVLDLQPTAYNLATKILPTAGGSTARDLTANDRPVGSLLNSSLDYLGVVRAAIRPHNEAITQSVKDTLHRAAHYGWILSGSFYFTLSSLNASFVVTEKDADRPQVSYIKSYDSPLFPRAARDALNINVPTTDISDSNKCNPNPPLPTMDDYICKDFSDALNSQPPTPAPPSPPGAEGKQQSGVWWAKTPVPTPTKLKSSVIDDAGGAIKDIGSSVLDFASSMSREMARLISDFVFMIANKIMGIFNSFITDYLLSSTSGILSLEGNNTDPIVALSELGYKILGDVEYIWLVGPFWVLTAAMAATLITCGNAGNAVTDVVMWFMPFAMAIMMILFGMGLSFAYYIPLVPLIVVLFTGIGWFAAVIEAMVAGPFVALALVVPEGQHEIFGPAYQAVMQLFGLFARPALIIFGFIFASIMTHVGIWLFNFSLLTAWLQGGLASHIKPGIAPVLGPLALMSIYMMIVVQIVERSFSLVYEIPTRVLEWVGIQVKGYGEAEAVGAVKAGAAEKLATVGQAGQKQGEAGFQAAEAGGKGFAKAYKKFKDKGNVSAE